MRKVTPEEFHQHFSLAKQLNPRISAYCTQYHISDLQKMNCYSDGFSGYCLKHDGEITAVFSATKGKGQEIVKHALSQGGKKLDCFDGYLVQFYSSMGFKEYKREKNWNNGPDVVYMERK